MKNLRNIDFDSPSQFFIASAIILSFIVGSGVLLGFLLRVGGCG